ncbi:MAG: tRNA uridine-5-carboxymethylaminomethyl(34) synthesis enzyme MnmG [Dehalococcoidia bacterium]|nr:tRNA uridine-5-carboxymethylaminomethyl(34) synthesis enzyme MnmG [Dehalococcoidia bacterium]
MYDVAVIGAGHAGCEAALAAARMGCRTLLLTMNLDTIALMPCNPSVGGPAKGHVVRELDALGGQMARTTDRTFIQIRMLNTGKGPAVQVPRAQADKRLYMLEMKKTLERQPNLTLRQATITGLARIPPTAPAAPPGADLWPRPAFHLTSHTGQAFDAKTVVLTAGTSLAGRTITGNATLAAGRAGEPPALGISDALRAWGISLGRLKTGTPPRVDARTIDFTQTVMQPGSATPISFGFYYGDMPPGWVLERNPIYPAGPETPWRPQLPCYLIHTNAATHETILRNLDRAPMFNGAITARGPRYCPSIEDKVHRFRDKPAHGLFLEPEGWETNEVYVQGANTSLPEDVQIEMLRTIPALARAEVMRAGYAVEYDYIPPSQTRVTLESKSVDGLFFAGQMNGTSGYEEAAGQGFLAGANAALHARQRPPLILQRDVSYIGVMADDLVTHDLVEPYRLMTSRAEFRLLLRQDNADLRLSPIGRELGLIGDARMEAVERKRWQIDREMERLPRVFVSPAAHATLESTGAAALGRKVSALDFLRRQDATYNTLVSLGLGDLTLHPDAAISVEVAAKYEGYIEKQRREVERIRRLETWAIPRDFDYAVVTGFRAEAREKLMHFRPATVGQAGRILGVTPADMSILVVHLERLARSAPLTHSPASL